MSWLLGKTSPQESPAQQQQQEYYRQQQRPQQPAYAPEELRVDVEQVLAQASQHISDQSLGLDVTKDSITAQEFRQEWQRQAEEELRLKLPQIVRKLNERGDTLESKNRLLELTVSKMISRIAETLMNKYFSEETQLASEGVLHECEKFSDGHAPDVDSLRARRDQRTYAEPAPDPRFTNMQSMREPRQGLEGAERCMIADAIQMIELGHELVGLDLQGGEKHEFRERWKQQAQAELIQKMPMLLQEVNTKYAGESEDHKAEILELTVRRYVTWIGEDMMASTFGEETRQASDQILPL